MNINELMAGVEVEGAIQDELISEETVEEGAESQNNNEQGTETTAESPAENKPTEEAPSQEGAEATEGNTEEANTPDETNDLPLNKHPRFKEVVDEKNYFKQQLERSQEQIQQLQEMVKPFAEQVRSQQVANKPVESVKVPKFIADVWGEDPETLSEFKNAVREEAQRVVEEQRQTEAREREQYQAIKEQETAYISQQFKAIEEKYGDRLEEGTSERHEFTKFYIQNPISRFDANGKPVYDLVAGYDLFKQIKQAKQSAPSPATQQKKAIASQTIDRSSVAPTHTGLTKEQMSGMSFSEIATLALKEEGLLN